MTFSRLSSRCDESQDKEIRSFVSANFKPRRQIWLVNEPTFQNWRDQMLVWGCRLASKVFPDVTLCRPTWHVVLPMQMTCGTFNTDGGLMWDFSCKWHMRTSVNWQVSMKFGHRTFCCIFNITTNRKVGLPHVYCVNSYINIVVPMRS